MNSIPNFFLRGFYPYLWLILAGFLLYFKTIFFELTYLDDNVWILDYYWFIKSFSFFFSSLRQPDLISGLFYRPILNLSFMFNASLGGNDIKIYHLTNLIIHSMNSCLVFALFEKLKVARPQAFLVALIFTIHPVLTGAVSWIPGRTDSLLAAFVILSFIGFIRFIDRLAAWRYYIAHLIFLVLALLTKETAIALPVLCFLYHAIISPTKRPIKDQWICLSAWAVILLGWFFIRQSILPKADQVEPSFALQTVIENFPALISYLGKIFFPVNLSVLPILRDMSLIPGIITAFILGWLVFYSKHKRINYVIFGLAWFLLFVLPSLFLSFLKHEYRLYLPIIGCFLILLEIDSIKSIATNRRGVTLVAIVMIVLFSIAFTQADHYRNRYAFWENAVKTSPHSPLAHRNLGAMYYLDGKLDLAQKEYLQSLGLNPHEPMVHNNLGLIYMNRGQFQDAEKEYQEEIRVNPAYDNVYMNLGVLYFHQGEYPLAIRAWGKAVELNPKNIEARQNLALLYFNQGDIRKASFYSRQLEEQGSGQLTGPIK